MEGHAGGQGGELLKNLDAAVDVLKRAGYIDELRRDEKQTTDVRSMKVSGTTGRARLMQALVRPSVLVFT